MGRAEERRARQRGGRRAAPPTRSSEETASTAPTGPSGTTSTATTATAEAEPTVIGGRAAARKAAQAEAKGRGKGKAGKGKNDKSFLRRMFTWKKIVGAVFGFCLLGMGAFIAMYMMIDIPAGNADAELQSNVYKYSDGSLLTRDGERNREIVDLAKVPKKVQYTFVAAENKTFYQDGGVDLKGTARGLLNTLSGKGTQGGSTITQQYVKNYYLTADQTVTRKLKELVISLKLDREKSKDYILAGYINTSYYGRGAYGIQAAAQAYYRVDAEDLNVQQGAYLAALLQAPSQYDWAVASPTGQKLVKARWNYVLDNMVGQGWLDEAKRAEMKFPVPKEPKAAPGMGGQTGYLVDAANDQLAKQLVAQGTADNVNDALTMVKAGGWTITLNIDKKRQKALESAAKSQLTSKLDPKKRKVDADVQAGAVSVNPKTGAVVALYGGTDYYKHFRSNATRVDYQPASTFKPVILAAALDEDAKTQSGKAISANTIYDGTSKRQVVNNGTKVGFAPENEDDQDYGDITVQTAMNKSVNSVFAQMGVDVGMDKVLKVGSQMGMDTADLKAVPAQTLGTMGASPWQMAGVYATLDNHGRQVTPTIIKAVENSKREVKLPDPIGAQIVSREAADTVTSVLTGVVDDGTAKKSVAENTERDGRKVAGKTGTSDDNLSAWFTGFTPDLVTSVGLFGEAAKGGAHVSLTGATGLIPAPGRINGGGYPAQIWAAYTFGVASKNAKFDLDTTQGAAVQPSTTPTVSETPSQTPSETPSETPTTKPPTSSAPPSQTPTTSAPVETPTTSPPVSTPVETPTEPENPLEGDDQ
ncbi:transglycosylase domain-containing protein [Streptomyces sp. NPDC088794]|uniref:transglycosylase domain-containing protein n=1 Tax=Streptomyces sp. NPDC088794 TaxID=3365902 RepID=UPI0038236FD2